MKVCDASADWNQQDSTALQYEHPFSVDRGEEQALLDALQSPDVCPEGEFLLNRAKEELANHRSLHGPTKGLRDPEA